MNDSNLSVSEHRRLLLKFLLASPLMGLSMCDPVKTNEAATKATAKAAPGISQASDAINVFDFESLAKDKLPPAHYGYLMTGVDDDLTIRANRDAFSKVKLKMRRLVDTSRMDMSVEIFGKKWPTPIFLCPVSSQRAFHEDGEVATARAAKARNHLQLLSTVTTTSVEDVTKERGAPLWYQLYALNDWNGTLDMIRRAEGAGAEALVFTVDLLAGSNRETLERMSRVDTRQCKNCHSESRFERKPMVTPKNTEFASNLSWDYVDKLRSTTSMKLVLKGIERAEDAQLCLRHGVDGIVVSNHGGRASETYRGTLECLPEVVGAVKGKIPVLIDGGFRRGTDIFKALALGAAAVGIGRPYIWGLAAFGQEGVDAVLRILTDELALTMGQAGTSTIKEITKDYLTV